MFLSLTATHFHQTPKASSPLMFSGRALVVDSGGTHSRFNVLNDTTDQLLLETVKLKTPPSGDAFVKTINSQKTDMNVSMNAGTNPAGIDYIALAVAGPVNIHEGKVLGINTGAYHTPGTSFAKAVTNETGLPTVLVNDADAFVLGEVLSPKGAMYGKKNVLGITLGTGIGGGFVLNGELVTVNGRSVAEVGHIVIDQNGREVGPPRTRGCWESYASGSGLNQTAKEILAQEQVKQSDSVRAFMTLAEKSDISQMTTYDLIKAVKAQNPVALQIIDRWHDHIAAGLASVINVLGTTDVVVGGSMSQFVDYARLTERVKPRLIFPQEVKDTLTILPSNLGDDAALIGAGYFAEQQLAKSRP